MNKSYEELATDMTVAWINAVGQCCTTGKFSASWLEAGSVTKAYTEFFESIVDAVKSASK